MVRPKDKSARSLGTFSRQKLALIQGEYDPKHCNNCGKDGSLQNCTKCKVAMYCSKECQVKDWEKKHKTHCKEIRRLQKNISTAVKEEEKEVMDSNSSNIEQIKSEIDPLDGPVTSESGVTFISQKRLRITSLYDSKSCGGCGKGQVGLRRCKRC